MRLRETDAPEYLSGSRHRRSLGTPENELAPIQYRIFERTRSKRANLTSDGQGRFGGDGWFDMSLEMIKANLKPKFLRLLEAGRLKHVTGNMMRHHGENALGHKTARPRRKLPWE